MNLPRLFVSGALAIAVACGDDDGRGSEPASLPPDEEPIREVDEEEREEELPEGAALEAACFEGDREACDQLGH